MLPSIQRGEPSTHITGLGASVDASVGASVDKGGAESGEPSTDFHPGCNGLDEGLDDLP